MNPETPIVQEIRLTAGSQAGVRLFRNNVGVATHDDGSTVVYGLCKGSSDLVGWTSVVITPEMVGRRVAIFTAFEVKSATGRLSSAQEYFLNAVRIAGGIQAMVRSAAQALAALRAALEALRAR